LLVQEALRPYILAKARILFNPYVAPVAGKPGLPVTIRGLSFSANETVSVYWGEDKTGQLEGTATADAYGNVGYTFTVPQNLDPDSYPVTIVRTNQQPANVVTYVKVIPATLTVTSPGIRNGQIVTARIAGFLPNKDVNLSFMRNCKNSISHGMRNEMRIPEEVACGHLWLLLSFRKRARLRTTSPQPVRKANGPLKPFLSEVHLVAYSVG
jgi:hypothetical protein